MEGNKKNRRKAQDQARAAQLKRDGIERTTGRCPICNKIIHADYLDRGMASHRCA